MFWGLAFHTGKMGRVSGVSDLVVVITIPYREYKGWDGRHGQKVNVEELKRDLMVDMIDACKRAGMNEFDVKVKEVSR